MIRSTVDGHQLLAFVANDAGDVLMQVLSVLGSDQCLPPFDGENDLDINLRVRVCHLFDLSTNLSPLRGEFVSLERPPILLDGCHSEIGIRILLHPVGVIGL